MSEQQSHEKTSNPTKTDFVPKNQESIPKIDPKDPKLLDTIARKYSNKIVGETKNIKTLLCCLLSKDLPKEYRLSVIISNQSSTGKSYLLNNILEPFRDDYNTVIDYTDFTEAHFKRSQTNVNGKIIKVEQLESRDEKGKLSFHRLKHLLSEGRIRFGIVDQDEKGKRAAKDFEIVGVPVIVTTATDTNLDRETENRFLVMELDESEKQTENIHRHTLDKYTRLPLTDTWQQDVEELRKFFSELKTMAQHVRSIIIPFTDKIKSIIPRNLEMRRDLPKILNLTCIIAFIHGLNRPYLIDAKGETFIKGVFDLQQENTYHIIARPEDFFQAFDIAGETIRQTINKSSHRLMEMQALLKKVHNEKPLEDQGVLVKDIVKSSGYSENRARELLNELVEKGFAYKDTESSKQYKYYPTDKKFSELKPENILFSEKDFENWIKTNVEPFGDRFSVMGSWDDVLPASEENLRTNLPQVTENTPRNMVSCDSGNFRGMEAISK